MTTLRRYFRDTGQPDPLRQGQGAGVICQYSFSGDSEQYVHLGRDHPFQILIIPPFFEDMNRTRWLLLAAMRTQDEARIGTILPDPPGQKESLAPDESTALAVWREALERSPGHYGYYLWTVSARER